MHRRTLLKSLAAVPAAIAMPHIPVAARPVPAPVEPILSSAGVPAQVAQPVARFLEKDLLAALTKLCELLVPPSGGYPGALEVNVPEFLDFLIGQSPRDRQQIYQRGLEQLNDDARRQFGHPFAELPADQADVLLAPLKQPWTYGGPKSPFAQFLFELKRDTIEATENSREWQSEEARRKGRSEGFGTFWRTIE